MGRSMLAKRGGLCRPTALSRAGPDRRPTSDTQSRLALIYSHSRAQKPCFCRSLRCLTARALDSRIQLPQNSCFWAVTERNRSQCQTAWI
jgi:hypothetical protein